MITDRRRQIYRINENLQHLTLTHVWNNIIMKVIPNKIKKRQSVQMQSVIKDLYASLPFSVEKRYSGIADREGRSSDQQNPSSRGQHDERMADWPGQGQQVFFSSFSYPLMGALLFFFFFFVFIAEKLEDLCLGFQWAFPCRVQW